MVIVLGEGEGGGRGRGWYGAGAVLTCSYSGHTANGRNPLNVSIKTTNFLDSFFQFSYSLTIPRINRWLFNINSLVVAKWYTVGWDDLCTFGLLGVLGWVR